MRFNGRSGQQLDSNQRPAVPKTAALPGCAIPRYFREAPWIHASASLSKAPAQGFPRRDRGPFIQKSRQNQKLMAAEQRMGDPVAGLDTVFLRGPGNHLEDTPREPPRRDDLGRHRLGILGDPQDRGRRRG